MVAFDDITVAPPEPGPHDWNDDGVVILKNFMPEELMVAYEQCWMEENSERPGGWPFPTPYMGRPAVADLFTYGPLCTEMERLLGEPAGLHLCLTGWVTTARNWHQDSYLNPPHVGDSYVAATPPVGSTVTCGRMPSHTQTCVSSLENPTRLRMAPLMQCFLGTSLNTSRGTLCPRS